MLLLHEQIVVPERMAHECSPFLHGLNKMPTVQLKTQYHIVPGICAVAKVMSYRMLARVSSHQTNTI